MKMVADYMLAIGEINETERKVPFSLAWLNGKSHLADQEAPFKLTEWYGYAPVKKPLLKTVPVSARSTTAILSGLTLITDGESAITESGICWSTVPNPTLADAKVIAGADASVISLEGLSTGIPYYLKAYAINKLGVAYGNELAFLIKEDGQIEIVKK